MIVEVRNETASSVLEGYHRLSFLKKIKASDDRSVEPLLLQKIRRIGVDRSFETLHGC